MTIDEAINELIQCYSLNSKTAEKQNEAISMAIEALEEQQWIPCSKRLPNKFEDVWVTDNRGKVAVCRMGHTGWRDMESGEWMYCLDSIVAWMPYYVPDPYQEEE